MKKLKSITNHSLTFIKILAINYYMLIRKNWNYTNIRKGSPFLNNLPAYLWKYQAHSWYWIVKYKGKLACGFYKWKIELNSIYWLLGVSVSPYVSMTWKGVNFLSKMEVFSLRNFRIAHNFSYIKRLSFSQTNLSKRLWTVTGGCLVDSRFSSMDHGWFILSYLLWHGWTSLWNWFILRNG